MGSKKSPPPPQQDQPIVVVDRYELAMQEKAAYAASPEGIEKAARDKAIRGGESEADIATREAATLANPKKQKLKGRRSLVSSASLGTGVTASRETLG